MKYKNNSSLLWKYRNNLTPNHFLLEIFQTLYKQI